MSWYKIENRTESFLLEKEPYIIHVIKTGFVDKYMIVYEDPFELYLGEVSFNTKEEVEKKYNIKLSI